MMNLFEWAESTLKVEEQAPKPTPKVNLKLRSIQSKFDEFIKEELEKVQQLMRDANSNEVTDERIINVGKFSVLYNLSGREIMDAKTATRFWNKQAIGELEITEKIFAKLIELGIQKENESCEKGKN